MNYCLAPILPRLPLLPCLGIFWELLIKSWSLCRKVLKSRSKEDPGVSIQCIKSDMINMSSCRFGNQNVRYLEVSLVGWRDCGSLKLLISGSLTKYMRLRSARSFASKATTLHCILDLASFKGSCQHSMNWGVEPIKQAEHGI